MPNYDGKIWKWVRAFVLLVFTGLPLNSFGQAAIFDSLFSFSAGRVKTSAALDIISRHTGYNFSYDSRLVDSAKVANMTFPPTPLKSILNSVLGSDSLNYSVIDNYIIISRPKRENKSTAVRVSDFRHISGSINDSESGESLPFATVAFKNSGKGTVSNQNGEFGLNITGEMESDTLSFSYLGYIRYELPVSSVHAGNISVKMQREFISIPEIIIRNQLPQNIIYKCRDAIAKNYGKTPALMTGFYREGVMKKNELQTYSEAVINIYKSSYAGSLQGDQIRIYKSRKIENRDITDTLAVVLKAGLSTCLELDGARFPFDFISAESMKDYVFRLTDIVTYEDESAYVIDFEQRPDVEQPLYKGTIYINTSDYGILSAEFEFNRMLVKKLKDLFVAGSARGFNTWPVSVKYTVSYRKMNSRYYLNHVRGDLLFATDRRKIFFNSQFRVFFELAITETSTENVQRFEREELAPVHSVFSRTIQNYDPQFWGSQDFLKPEDNLLRALKNMNVKLKEFSE